MGSCSSCQPSTFIESHISSEEQSQSKITRRKNVLEKKASTLQCDDENIIASENSLHNSIDIPAFVKSKYIKEGIVQQRGNRFMADLEEEVRFRIKQIQQQEELEKSQLLNESLVNQTSFQEQSAVDLNNSAHFNQSISFQNSHDFQHNQQLPSKIYLPRQCSQFAPKKDNDTVTYNSQISQTINSKNIRKGTTPTNKSLTIKEDIKTNLGSVGSQTNHGHNDNSVQFSDHYIESSSKERSVRSILKTSIHQPVLLRNKSIKSSYTTMKQKKVSFSNDTNYYSSRTTKRNQTSLFFK